MTDQQKLKMDTLKTLNIKPVHPASFHYDSKNHMQNGHWSIPIVLDTLSKAQYVIEIGAWLGHTSISFAKLSTLDTKIICVDPWDPQERHCRHFQNSSKKDTYEQFVSNCFANAVENQIIPVRLDSISASKLFNYTYDLIYIDGDHSEEAVYQDLKHWYPKKSSDASLICGDDWTLFDNWAGHNQEEFNNPQERSHSSAFNEEDQKYMVRRGVKRFAQEQGIKTIQSFGRLWWFEKR